MNQNNIEYRGYKIQNIILGSYGNDQIEITIVIDKLIFKNIYLPYIPKLHDRLFGRVPLNEKKEVFWEVILKHIDHAVENQPFYVGFRDLTFFDSKNIEKD